MKRRHDSSLREAFIGILATVGPFFGVRYRPPRVEIPVASTPAGDDLDPAIRGRAEAVSADGDALTEDR